MSKFCPRHPTPSTAHQPGNVNLNLIPLGPTAPGGQLVYVYLNEHLFAPQYVPLNYNINGYGKGLEIGTIGTINPCLRRSSFRTCLELLINGWSGSQNVVYPLEVRRFFIILHDFHHQLLWNCRFSIFFKHFKGLSSMLSFKVLSWPGKPISFSFY